MKHNYIIEDEGGFYYWDETDDLIGPFSTYSQAQIALNAYLQWAAKDHKQEKIHKLRDELD